MYPGEDAQVNSEEKIIREFMADWSRPAIKEAFERYISEDCVWRNTGFPDAVGKRAVLSTLDAMIATGMCDVEVEIGRLVADDGVVFVERVDRIFDESGQQVFAPEIAGVFEVRGDQIVTWNDYFDPAPFRTKKRS